jgi:broad specificity phosphatase PhoE
MTTLTLIRHCESIANSQGIYQGQSYDTPLSARGQKQAQVLSQILASEPINLIYASPLKRTFQTAQIIAKSLKKKVTTDRRLLEINHGDWEGKKAEAIKKKYSQLFKLWKSQPTQAPMPNGETIFQVQNRVKNFLKFVQSKHNYLLIVSHDATLRTLLALILNLSLDSIWDFRLDSGGLTQIQYQKSWFLNYLNQNHHLKNLKSQLTKQAL